MYVEVFVGDATFRGQEALTYMCTQKLKKGSLVIAPLRDKKVLCIVKTIVEKPSFAVRSILEVLAISPLPLASIKLLEWMHSYYPAPLGVITQLFLPRGLSKISITSEPQAENWHGPPLPILTDDQQKAIRTISGSGLHMLHGDTGTGKTRVYIELTRKTLESGKSALILTPEIGLTAQLAEDFKNVFGHRVLVLHSQLTDATRRKLWLEILTKQEPIIVIGARSALFSPLRSLGLLVVDEAHETAYKQDQSPYYMTTRVAAKLANIHNATLVLGSATPLVSDYFVAAAKARPLIRMQQLAANSENTHPKISIINLRDTNNFTRSSYLSNDLIHAITQTINRGEQVLLYLNRRGTARIICCDMCGWQALCPHCDLPLVYHGDHHRMICHTCGYRSPNPTSCPSCSSASITFRSVGTKAITADVAKIFPKAKIQRFDADNKDPDRLEKHFKTIQKGDVDILIGTQTLAKGLDLPKLALVGVIIAETNLFLPDFTAQERTYQLLSQVVGRIGRGHRAGQAIIQTYTPNNLLLQQAITKNWSDFYNAELKQRAQFNFPPFCYLLKLTCRRATDSSAESTAEKLAEKLKKEYPFITIEGPSPSFHQKIGGKFQWQIVIKAKDRKDLTAIIRSLPSGWSYDIDPSNLL